MKKKTVVLLGGILILCLILMILWFIWSRKNRIPIRYIVHMDGITTTYDFETGGSSSIPTSEYCKSEGTAVIWIHEEDSSFLVNRNYCKLMTIYLTDADGNTERLFDTKQLYDLTGHTGVGDMTYTANGKLIFAAAGDSWYSILEYVPILNEFHYLVDDTVYGAFSANGQELLYTLIREDGNSYKGRIMSYNLDTNEQKFIRDGALAARIDENWYLSEEKLSGNLIIHDAEGNTKDNLIGLKDNNVKIQMYSTPIISDTKMYALIDYYTTRGANDNAIVKGILNLESGKLWPLDLYYFTVLRKIPPHNRLLPAYSMNRILG